MAYSGRQRKSVSLSELFVKAFLTPWKRPASLDYDSQKHRLISVYCPFPGAPSSQHRKIFIAVCPTHHKCASGWKVIRQLRTEEPAQVIAQDAVFGDDGDDDWGVEENEDETVSWAATQMQVLYRHLSSRNSCIRVFRSQIKILSRWKVRIKNHQASRR